MSKRKVAMQAVLLLGFIAMSGPTYAADAMNANLTACPSDKTAIGGVNACGKVWKLGSGTATLAPGGKLVVDLHGLVLNDASVGQANGTPDGVDAVAVAVICGGTVAAQTEPMALSKTGDAHVEASVQVPQSCTSPMILVRERYEGKSADGLRPAGGKPLLCLA
jgi:hypothetical protein